MLLTALISQERHPTASMFSCQSTSRIVPRCTLPQPKFRIDWSIWHMAVSLKDSPTSRQCFSMRRDRATFSPTSVHAGDVSCIFARSALTLRTRPPVDVDPILMSRSSFLTSFETFVCFLSSVLTPNKRRRRKRLISSSIGKMSERRVKL